MPATRSVQKRRSPKRFGAPNCWNFYPISSGADEAHLPVRRRLVQDDQ
jgi:hypothetical protein